MKIKDLVELTEARVFCNEQKLGGEATGCYVGDLLSWVMGRAQSGDCWITIMSNVNVVGVAVLADVALILLPEGVILGEDALAKARDQGVLVAGTELTAYECAGRIYGALQLQ